MDLKKVVIILIVVLVVVGFGFLFIAFNRGDFLQTDTGVQEVSGNNNSVTASEEGLMFLRLIQSLGALTLDTKVFDNSVFQGLRDFSQPLRAEPVGRRNPFLPIGQIGTQTLEDQTVE